ncbi:MAG: hypothetical protein V4474_02380 [Patescibacteria group bacterium]
MTNSANPHPNEAFLAGLSRANACLIADWARLDRFYSELGRQSTQAFDMTGEAMRRHADRLVPDIKPETIAALKAECPEVVTVDFEERVAKARSTRPRIRDYVWDTGNEYLAEVRANTTKLLSHKVYVWISNRVWPGSVRNEPLELPASMAELVELNSRHHNLMDRRSAVYDLRKSVSEQCDVLQKLHRIYSGIGALEPSPDLVKAIQLMDAATSKTVDETGAPVVDPLLLRKITFHSYATVEPMPERQAAAA